jgi:uncharacterized membrane protein HdeD (DUF308 family)
MTDIDNESPESQDTGPLPAAEDDTAGRPTPPIRDRQAHEAARRAGWAAHNWPWVMGLGAVAVVFGLVVLSHAFGSLSALVWLTGLFLLFMGVAQLMTLGRGGSRRTHLLAAAITIVGGLVLLFWPGKTLTLVAVVAGITVLLWGLVRTVSAFRAPVDDRTWDIVAGGALIVLGIIMMAWPSATITLVGIFVGLVGIAWGVVTIVAAFKLREAGRHWSELHRRSRPAG